MRLPAKIALIVALSLGVSLTLKVWTSPSKLELAFELKSTNDIAWINKQVNQFKINTGNYPAHLKELIPEYVNEIPKDPWGEPYRFYSDEIYSMVFTLNQNKAREIIYSVQK